MGCGLRYQAGGILGLLRLVKKHEESLRYDLFMAGRSLDDLGTPALSWIDLRALVKWAPMTSAYARSYYGHEVAAWASLDVQISALIADLLASGNWQRSGGKGSKPKPLKRPGSDTKIGGKTVMELDQMDEFLGWSPRR